MAIVEELPVLQSATSVSEDSARPLPPSEAAKILSGKKPEWLKIRPPAGENYGQIKELLKSGGLHTVCQEAHCPNVAECWASGTATFMVGGDTCTRACRFCAVKTARVPPPLDPQEPVQVARSIAALKLKYVVLTSVDRDDLPDGGANHFAETIREIKRLDSGIFVEALVSDFKGDEKAVRIIVDSGLDVYAHNIETVKRLQYRVRDPRAGYEQSLRTLQYAKRYATERRGSEQKLFTKSSIMVGLGETNQELDQAFDDLLGHGVDVVTLGQYLRPSLKHLPVEKYLSPAEFDGLKTQAEAKGFLYVAAGPMVRSSYRAGELFLHGVLKKTRARDVH